MNARIVTLDNQEMPGTQKDVALLDDLAFLSGARNTQAIGRWPDDRARFYHVTFQFLKAMETIHFYFIYGLMDEQIWRSWWNLYRHYLASPGLEHYWTLRHDLFSERFQRFVNQLAKPGEPMTVANLLGTEVKS